MRRWALNVYVICVLVFLSLVVVQVLLAGMVVVATRMDWTVHKVLCLFLGLPSIIMLIVAYVGRLPRKTKVWTWVLFGLFILQAEILILLRASAPVLSAFHPVLALAEFALGVVLINQARTFAREAQSSERS
jgi:uncharacterized membrane protein